MLSPSASTYGANALSGAYDLVDFQLDPSLTLTFNSGASVLLEVTETAILPDMEHARITLDALRALGIKVAIDDFGAGFASFSLLRQLGFDVLKIDRSLVEGIGRNKSDESILEGMIVMGHNLGVQVVAEGVERADQCHWLESRGCDLLQGFHLGVPRPLC